MQQKRHQHSGGGIQSSGKETRAGNKKMASTSANKKTPIMSNSRKQLDDHTPHILATSSSSNLFLQMGDEEVGNLYNSEDPFSNFYPSDEQHQQTTPDRSTRAIWSTPVKKGTSKDTKSQKPTRDKSSSPRSVVDGARILTTSSRARNQKAGSSRRTDYSSYDDSVTDDDTYDESLHNDEYRGRGGGLNPSSLFKAMLDDLISGNMCGSNGKTSIIKMQDKCADDAADVAAAVLFGDEEYDYAEEEEEYTLESEYTEETEDEESLLEKKTKTKKSRQLQLQKSKSWSQVSQTSSRRGRSPTAKHGYNSDGESIRRSSNSRSASNHSLSTCNSSASGVRGAVGSPYLGQRAPIMERGADPSIMKTESSIAAKSSVAAESIAESDQAAWMAMTQQQQSQQQISSEKKDENDGCDDQTQAAVLLSVSGKEEQKEPSSFDPWEDNANEGWVRFDGGFGDVTEMTTTTLMKQAQNRRDRLRMTKQPVTMAM